MSRATLTIERAVREFWPLASLAALFAATALLRLWALAPYRLHVAGLAAFATAALWLSLRDARGFRLPNAAKARARLGEGPPERPIVALSDTIAVSEDDSLAQKIWAAHRRRMAQTAVAQRPGPLGAALRAGPLLFVEVLATQGTGGAPFAEALTPPPGKSAAIKIAPSIKAWVSPPAYIGAAPAYLSERTAKEGSIALPTCSVINLRVFDADTAPALTLISAQTPPQAPARTQARTPAVGAENAEGARKGVNGFADQGAAHSTPR